MTTAHRPTWHAAAGSSEQGGNRMMVPTRQYSSRDMPGQLTMKERADRDYSKKDFKKDLLEREGKSKNPAQEKPTFGYDDEDAEASEPTVKKIVKTDAKAKEETKELENKPKYVNPFPQDADDDGSDASSDIQAKKKSEKDEENPDKDDDGDSSDDERAKKVKDLDEDSDDDDDSDNEKLFEEYERIKKQREEEQKRKQKEKEESLQKEREEELMKGNPLLDGSTYSLEKRWFEDTVFKNQAKTEPKEKKKYINDTVRSDFHKKFLSKYILT